MGRARADRRLDVRALPLRPPRPAGQLLRVRAARVGAAVGRVARARRGLRLLQQRLGGLRRPQRPPRPRAARRLTSPSIPDPPPLPPGFRAGHWSDPEGATGCTAILPPAGSVAAAEVRGGGPGTRESDLLSPASHVPGVQALLLTGGSAFGLHAADGVAGWLEERDRGHATRVANVPLVFAAVVYDLPLGDPAARPGADAGAAACDVAAEDIERGSVGVGTGCAVGKLLGGGHWTKGGFGAASLTVDGATVCALAAVNAFGEVVAEDGAVLAGVWRDGAYERTSDLLRAGELPPLPGREATTLVCVLTDAPLSKLEAWKVARAATSGVARAVVPSATAVDGDLVACLAGGEARAEPLVVEATAADAAAAAIRDAARQATALAGCPAGADRPILGRDAPA